MMIFRRVILPLIAIVAFLAESIFVEFLPSGVFVSNRDFVPHFVLIVVIFISAYANVSYGIIYGIICGIYYDIVYTEVIGVYTFSFSMMAYVMGKLSRLLQANIVIVVMLTVVSTAAVEFFVYFIYWAVARYDVTLELFLTHRLLPTLVLNSAFAIVIAYPLKQKLAKYYAE